MGPAIITELCRYMPSEILINPALLDLKEVTNYVRQHTHALVELREDACYQQRVMEDAMTAQFGADWRNTCGFAQDGLVPMPLGHCLATCMRPRSTASTASSQCRTMPMPSTCGFPRSHALTWN